MAFSTLDPKSALLVIDLQQGITGMPLAHPTDAVIARCTDLIAAFRRHDLPIVLVNVAGTPPRPHRPLCQQRHPSGRLDGPDPRTAISSPATSL